MRFTKYQGLGNDFVVLDVNDPSQISADLARQLCDRHFGIGADGVLLVSPSSQAVAKMTVINADGSVPEMCGNGLRCVALHLEHARPGLGPEFLVETGAGPLHCRLEKRGEETWVDLSLGVASVGTPMRVSNGADSYEFTPVSIGNPHAITFDRQPELAAIDDLAPRVSARFPAGANVEFVRQNGKTDLDVVVWERGVGRTLACGTGAGAVAAAAARAGRVPFGEPVTIRLPGGALELTVREADLSVRLCGPAARVFEGQLP